MKIGNIVRVKHSIPKYRDIAIILEVDMGHHVKCLWHDGNINWCPKRRLEVVIEN